MIYAVMTLSLILGFFLVYIIILKKDIKKTNRDLVYIIKENTNKILTTSSFDNDVVKLHKTINELLEKQKRVFADSARVSKNLKMAITNVSHDLRTPLTSVSGYIQLLAKQEILKEKQQEYLGIIKNKLNTLTTLLDDLFEFSKLVEKEVELNLEKINISNVLCDCIAIFYNDFEQSEFKINLNNIESELYYITDVTLLKRVFLNVLKNILEHAIDELVISLDKDKKQIIFENNLKNSNIDISKIFERFYTKDESRSNKNAGLGLAISKEIMSILNGNILADVKGNKLIMIIKLIR